MRFTPAPLDTTHCQAFYHHGEGRFAQCFNTPAVIATERVPQYGKIRGQLAMCRTCYTAMVGQVGPLFYSTTDIEATK